jgi:hypothetical protein
LKKWGSFMSSEKENKTKENTQISLNPRMSHTCAAVGQTKTAQFAETDILTTLPLVAIGLRPCAHRHRVSSSRSHNSITRSNNNNPCMPRTTKHQKRKQIKQLQLQRANSQDQVSEGLQGTALLAG